MNSSPGMDSVTSEYLMGLERAVVLHSALVF